MPATVRRWQPCPARDTMLAAGGWTDAATFEFRPPVTFVHLGEQMKNDRVIKRFISTFGSLNDMIAPVVAEFSLPPEMDAGLDQARWPGNYVSSA